MDRQQLGLIGPTPLFIAEEVGALAKQLGPGLQGSLGEALVGTAIEPLLQRAQHGLGIGARLHPKQVEMVDRQFQARSFADN